jgi:hypothetical protein
MKLLFFIVQMFEKFDFLITYISNAALAAVSQADIKILIHPHLPRPSLQRRVHPSGYRPEINRRKGCGGLRGLRCHCCGFFFQIGAYRG